MGIKKLLAGAVGATLGLSLAGLAASSPASAGTYNLPENSAVTLTAAGTGIGNADQFPSQVTQYGMSTFITDVNVSLNNVNHTYKGDLDIELVSPRGTAIALMSDVCNGFDTTSPTNIRSYNIDDQAGGSFPTTAGVLCPSGSYKPTNGPPTAPEVSDTWAVTPNATTLAQLNGQNPNGTWSLYVRDDANGDTGQIGSWSITITTAGTAPITFPVLGSSGFGNAAPYPIPIAVSNQQGLITDANLELTGLTHSFLDDLDMLLVSPNGTKVIVMSDACGAGVTNNLSLTFDDQAASLLPDNGPCASGSYKPSNFEGNETMPPPAPAQPYASSMSAFNGQSPNGVWSLYITDDFTTDGGWLAQNPKLTFTTTDVTPPQTTITKKPTSSTATTVKVRFSSNEAHSTFQCKLDKGKYRNCKSTLTLKHLKVGKHKLLVRATDAAGNVDKTPAKAIWSVKPKPHHHHH